MDNKFHILIVNKQINKQHPKPSNLQGKLNPSTWEGLMGKEEMESLVKVIHLIIVNL
jgi:hypothetical protein